MATNFEKLKSEIAEMSAEEFAKRSRKYPMLSKSFAEHCRTMPYPICKRMSCIKCYEKWLNSESEVRKNDRPFAVGDALSLNEWDGEKLTGRHTFKYITYILDDPDYCAPGYVILGIASIEKTLPKAQQI